MARSVLLSSSLLALTVGCQEPPPEPDPTPSPVPAADTEPSRVDMHGQWRRFLDTPELRAAALERMKDLPDFGFGREATAEEVAAIDIDIMPDGTGLPVGSGSVTRGQQLYASQCVQCHGADGRGGDYEALVGREPAEGFPFAESVDHVVTVGNYWPYATTLYDYIHRAMPQAVPGSLPPDDVYSLVAYVLYLNDIVPENTVLDASSLPAIEMPARDRFVYDDREGGTELR